MNENTEVSIIIPAYNEEKNLKELTAKLISSLNYLGRNFEVIFVDDGSTDKSFDIIKELNQKDKRIKSIKLSRNFGQQIAILAGIDSAKGNIIITMDADLQHPPELIPKMLELQEDGYDVVYTIRRKTGGAGFGKRIFSKAFYWLFNKSTKLKLDRGSADFRLMNRKTADAFRQMREVHRFNRGLFSWMGFKHTGIHYNAPSRVKGKAKYYFKNNVRMALDGILSFSSFPLRFACYLGLIISLLSAIYAFWLVIIKLTGAKITPGWTQLIVTVIFFGGIQLFFIGIIGEYVSRVFEETKKRPLYLVDESVGIE
ncbi:MAG: glycosyltransferase family 2 protein [bacterium]